MKGLRHIGRETFPPLATKDDRGYSIATFMDTVDRVEQWRQVTEHYRSLTDDELIAIARQKTALTDVAQQALDAEILHRKIEIPPEEVEEEKPPALPESDSDSFYEAERSLVEIETVYSLRDALQLQELLEKAGIPFFMGDEKAPSVDAVKSNFANGVSVKIMRIGLPYATGARVAFRPEDHPDPKHNANGEDIKPDPVFCPKCNSDQIVLEEVEPDPSRPDTAAKFQWTCDSCGHHWVDDGILAEE